MPQVTKHFLPRQIRTIRFAGRSYPIADAVNLAINEHRQRNFQAAVKIYDLICAKAPDHAEIHINRGAALRELKRYDDALASFDHAINLNPSHAESHNNRGAILQIIKRYEDALESYDRAIALRPDYANAHFNRGSVLKSMNRHAEALASLDSAISLIPEHAEAYHYRGILLKEMREYARALASFDKAIALQPRNAVPYNNRGILMMVKGNMPEAEKMFLKAAELNPNLADPLFNLVNIRKYQTADNAEVRHIQALLTNRDLMPEVREHLYFSLGKIYDDCSLYDKAFACYEQANRLRNSQAAYDANAVSATTDRLIEVFNAHFLTQKFPYASESKTPLLIVGMPRSGTTLLANILSNHPAIATAGELSSITDFTSSMYELTGIGIAFPLAVQHMPPGLATQFINDYESRLRRDVGPYVRHVIDKNPLNFINLGLIAMLFPKARIIHCIRNPLDTALSNYFQRFPLHLDYAFDLRNIRHFYGEYTRLMEHWRTVLPLAMADVSYEDMVTDTKRTTQLTLDFLGLGWDERCLEPQNNPCAVETASQWQVRQPIYRESIERWRHYEKHLVDLLSEKPAGW